ncbi:hypothetical protein ACIF9R_06620 [Streptomyces sp. NPDC086080]|uniref:hypothetical protein n=1 Tax=Streptomyces sp. NPDC086080 TaxID=3365748 RepID=UPI0037D2594B
MDWERADAAVGTRLPTDYKEYVRWFGPGDFDAYLIVCVPGVENSEAEPAARFAREYQEARLLKVDQPQGESTRPPGARAGWMVALGFTTGGDGLYRAMSGADPDRWTVAGQPGRGSDFRYFDGSITAFLHVFLWDTVEMPFIPEAECDPPVPFEPDTGEWRAG